jgi:hypothetical protein
LHEHLKSYTIFAQQGRVNDHSSGSRLQLEHAVAGAQANKALQPIAFGAQDRAFFDGFFCALASAEHHTVRWQPSTSVRNFNVI